MAGVSKIKRLPRELRDLVHEMLEAGRTVTEVADALKAAGADASRSGVGRYRLEWQESMRDLHELRQFAEVSIRSLADNPESRTARMNCELLEAALFRAVMALNAVFRDDPKKAIALIGQASKAQMMLSKAVRDDAEKTIKATDFSEERAESATPYEEPDRLIRVEFVRPDSGLTEKEGEKSLEIDQKAAPKADAAQDKD